MIVHFHHCPYCYEAFECTMRCTIEPDLEDRGRDFGSHTVCHDVTCHIEAAIKRHGERLDRRKEEVLRKLQSPPSTVLVGLRENSHQPYYSSVGVPSERTVRILDDGNGNGIRDALALVCDGGTVIIEPGNYVVEGGISGKGGNLVIRGNVRFLSPGPANPAMSPPLPSNKRRRSLPRAHCAPTRSTIRPHGVR